MREFGSRWIMEARVLAGAKHTFVGNPNGVWKGHTMGVSPESGPYFILEQISIGRHQQTIEPVPAQVFATTAQPFLDFDVARPHTDIINVRVFNNTDQDREFFGWMDGRAITPIDSDFAIPTIRRFAVIQDGDFAGIRQYIKAGYQVKILGQKV